ncbi:hypothetical protein [Sinomonas albida]|uniref:hypothetical protein n=1 Tax=Sinomonas albida TaxID=369942 RepID=UPI00301A73AF
MSLKISDYVQTLEIDSRAALEAEPDRVVDIAVQHALSNAGYGVLVTRRRPGTFTVELSDEVPPGAIAELDLMSS